MFSFRLDKLGDDQNMKSVFSIFNDKFLCESFMICYEDKTKAGIPCKAHFHGIGKYTTKIKLESQRDKMKKYFSKAGFDKDKSQVHIIIDEKEYNKALIYTVKQQSVFMTDLKQDIVDELLKQSQEYQDKVRPLSNTWKEHEPLIFKLCQTHYKNTNSLSRHEMLRIVFNYLYDWNHSHSDELAIKRYANATIMTFMYNTEIKLLPKIQSLQLFMQDFQTFGSNCYAPLPELHYDSDGDFNFIDSEDI